MSNTWQGHVRSQSSTCKWLVAASRLLPIRRHYLVRTWVAELRWRHRPVSVYLFSRSWQWWAMTSRYVWWRHWPPAARTCWWWELHRKLHEHTHARTHTYCRITKGQQFPLSGHWRSFTDVSRKVTFPEKKLCVCKPWKMRELNLASFWIQYWTLALSLASWLMIN